MMLGDFDLEELQQSNSLLGTLLFFSYMISIMLVLLNFFIAIVSNAFDEVNEEVWDEETETEFVQELKKAWQAILFSIAKCLPSRYSKVVKDQARKSMLSFSDRLDLAGPHVDVVELQSALTTIADRPVNLDEAKNVMAKYDVNNDGKLDQQEVAVMKRELCPEDFEKNRRQDYAAMSRRLDKVTEQLENLENLIMGLNSSKSPLNRVVRPVTRRELKSMSGLLLNSPTDKPRKRNELSI